VRNRGSDGSEAYALVKDSSAIHAVDPKFDGKRMVVACSPEHLRELAGQYKRRPFVEAELWAGKIDRAMLQHPGGAVCCTELIEETGLPIAPRPDRGRGDVEERGIPALAVASCLVV